MDRNPFWHFNSRFDALDTVQRYAAAAGVPQPREDRAVNFLGVVIDPVVHPPILADKVGTVEEAPLPNNWHADLAEWAAAFRAVDLSGETFTMIELGCGWGCWMNNTGVAARHTGRKAHVIGIEGDQTHIQFATDTLAENGFVADEYTLVRGIAAGTSGTALFPIQGAEGGWGSAPVFGASDDQVAEAVSSGGFDVLEMIPVSQIAADHAVINLLHIDIQGGEVDVVRDCLETLNDKVAYVVIGTHSRQIEGQLFDLLGGAGWLLEIERPAILSLALEGPVTSVDGLQGWRNLRILP